MTHTEKRGRQALIVTIVLEEGEELDVGKVRTMVGSQFPRRQAYVRTEPWQDEAAAGAGAYGGPQRTIESGVFPYDLPAPVQASGAQIKNRLPRAFPMPSGENSRVPFRIEPVTNGFTGANNIGLPEEYWPIPGPAAGSATADGGDDVKGECGGGAGSADPA